MMMRSFWKISVQVYYCHKLGHTHENCYILHGPPPSYGTIALKEYNELLRNCTCKQTSAQVASVDHPN